MNLTSQDFDYLRKMILDQAAIVMDPGKEYLVESRVIPVVKQEGLSDISELVKKLRSSNNDDLSDKVVDALTTNETSFFRDFYPFEALREKIIPDLIQKRKGSLKLNFWCAASASGQEPFSVAILLREHFPQLRGWEINFMATDISHEILNRCQNGKFSQLEINRGLPVTYMVKYFERHGTDWEAKPIIRDMINFSWLNLSHPFPFMPLMDIVFIRNVLIYFDVEMKKRILAKIRKIIKPDGYLFMGGAETTLNLDPAFERVNYKQSGCYFLKEETLNANL